MFNLCFIRGFTSPIAHGTPFVDPSTATTRAPWIMEGTYLIVWDTTTGKAIKRWKLNSPEVKAAFNPTRPALAVAERNGDNGEFVRLGLWDFQKETQPKK